MRNTLNGTQKAMLRTLVAEYLDKSTGEYNDGWTDYKVTEEWARRYPSSKKLTIANVKSARQRMVIGAASVATETPEEKSRTAIILNNLGVETISAAEIKIPPDPIFPLEKPTMEERLIALEQGMGALVTNLVAVETRIEDVVVTIQADTAEAKAKVDGMIAAVQESMGAIRTATSEFIAGRIAKKLGKKKSK